jgi:L-ascorbate metabolism protein UlaG (beta-lactamase superfamily)
MIALLASGAHAGEQRPGPQVIAQIRAHRSGIALWWVGNAGWLVKAGDLLIGIDLDLESEERVERPPISSEQLAGESLHAIHGNQMFTVLTREPDFVESIAHNCGYLVRLGGLTFFWPGDSVLTEEHLALRDVNVLFVSPTVHNMYLDRSAILINTLQPDLVIPQHFGTYRQDDENMFWTKGYPDELRLALSADLQRRYRKLAQGEMLLVP